MNPMNKSLALAVALVAATVAGCSPSQKAPPQEFGNAKLSVSTEATQSQIVHLTLTISAGTVTGSNPAMGDIVVELNQSTLQNQWTGALTNIPAGTARLFKAAAYNAAGTLAANLIYYGEAVAAVSAGSTATVAIMLQEQNVTPGPTRYSPQVTSLTLSNSYVLPSTPVSIHVSAVSPDGLGGILNYQWSSLCDAGSGSFTPTSGTGASLDTVFLAPNTNATCQLALLVKETANPSNKNTPLSVTTYVTVVVNNNFGRANVTAFPNSYPIVTVLGDFRYNYFNDVKVMPVGQQGDFQFSAMDPDGDNVKYTLTAQCGTSLANAATQPSLLPDYFWYLNGLTYVGKAAATDGTTFTSTGSAGVTPPSPYTSEWKPHFGGTSDGLTYTNPASDCIFTLTVNDLCTAGNCGTVPNGSLKTTTIGGVVITSGTVGIINATHPAKPTRAPVVEVVETVNQDGPAAVGVQSWDPQKIAYVDAGMSYNIGAAADDRWENAATPPTVVWSCNTGTLSAPANLVGTYAFGSGVANLTSHVVLTTGPSVPPNGQCTATFSSATTPFLSSVVTIQFQRKDACNTLPAGSPCSTGNACLTGQTCQGTPGALSCQGGSAVVCAVADGQCQTPTCDPALGCGVTNQANGTSCNKDSNGCTANDACVSGACTAGGAVTCSQNTNQCQSANGTCASTGNNTHTCNYVNLADGTGCNADSNGCTQNDACTAGVCNAGTAVTCSNTTNPCQASAGTCNSTGNNNFTCSFANVTNGAACNVAGTCVAGQTCNAGACQGGVPACPAGQGCNPTSPTPTCTKSVVAPQVARDLFLAPPGAVAIDPTGYSYVASSFTLNTPTAFGNVFLTSIGGNDIVVAKYDTAGNVAWAIDIGDDDGVSANDQTATGVAVNNGGRVGVIGKIAGAVTFGANLISSASGVSYIAALDSTGARMWANGYDLGANGAFARIASNPLSATGRFAVCGETNKTGVNPLTGVTYGGLQDAVLAVFDNAGNRLWAVQLATTGNESCKAVAVDDSGNVFAAGQFDGATLPFPGGPTLVGPGNTTRKFMWLAKFDGSTGATLAAVAFSGPAGGITPQAASVDAAGNVFVGGSFSGAPTFGLATITSAGSDDAFVAKFDGTALVPTVNPVRIGGSGLDLIKGLAVTSYGDVIATGTIQPSSAAFKTANGGFDTTGIAQLTVNGATAPDQLLVKLNGATLATDQAVLYGDPGTQNGDAVAVNRFTTGATRDAVTLVGTLTGSANYGAPAGSLTAGNASDVSVVFAKLQ